MMKKKNRNSAIILLPLIVFCYLSACTSQENTSGAGTASYPRMIERAKKDHRNLIMHSGLDTFLVTSVQVEKNRQEFTVYLNKLDSIHRANFNNPSNDAGKQLRIIMRDSVSYTLDEPHTIPFTKVARIERAN